MTDTDPGIGHVEVPGTDLRVSRLVLGTMTFGAQVGRDDASRMLDIAADAGVTMLDTANGYAGGASESLLGDLLAARSGHRFLVATKVGMPNPDAGDLPPLAPEAIRRCLDASLRRLRLDHVDVYYLHQPDRATPMAETLAELGRLVEAGKVRHVGVSNYAAWQIAELRRIAADAGLPAPVVSQPLYNLLSRRIEDEYQEFTRTAGITDIVYNPLGGGLLTGKHVFEETPAQGRFGTESGLGEMYRRRYWNRELFDAVTELGAVAADSGQTLPELAFRWLLGNPDVGAVLLGSSKVEHLASNIGAARGGPLPDDVRAACDRVWERLRGVAPAYNR
ncbi:aldo/keto reductase [Marinitenerispora sediminis]|uniref:Aldo/keto reductase n=2 Tax=Marinitenerispora sediminis TaxID=1931232 RepID=A0A368SYW9_9ACTN|nr:aldo/keto reductase [Marinitenerispora sediminis]RCV49813.1 aldo/keto reductase [Marinitenerispora sediminis]RCV50049.1 aldo/keto reductase [Marinitenerispora sediminis]